MNRWKTLMCSLLVLACCALVVPFAAAQFRASLQGTVTDPQGAVVPGATVTLTSNETSTTRQTTSNDSGFYAFTNLAPGRYTLVAERTGFKKTTLENVQVEAERSQGANIALNVGQASEEITVSADALPNLQTETAQVGGTVTTREIQNLPSYGRDPFQTLRLAPGVFGQESLAGNLPGNSGPGGTNATSSIFQTENQPQISANGQRTSSNNFQVDGTSVNSIAWNGAAVITPNSESVKEVQVVANSYSADVGRNNGAQVMVVSQNGTNTPHGSFLFKAHRPGLNAYQKWNGPGDDPTQPIENRPIKRDSDRFNQWAGSIGGPIIKNRLFAFFSYETLRNNTQSIGEGWYEAPQYLGAGTPGSLGAQILSFPGEGVSALGFVHKTCADVGLPATQCQDTGNGLDIGSPLTGLGLPVGSADPTFGQGGTPYGVGAGLDGVPDVIYANTVQPRKTVATQWNGRMDFQATSKDLLTFSTYWVPVTSNSYNGPTRAANAWTNDRLNWSASIVETHTFSPTLLNEARFNFTRWSWDEIASNPQEPWGLPQGNIDCMGGICPQFFGAPGPSVFAENTFNLRDTVSKVINTHNLRFGVDLYKEQRLDTAPWSARPSYNFHNLWDFANDAPFQENGNFDPVTGQPSESRKHVRSGMYAGFVQDDWKVRPNLTLNLGLRWEYFGPVSEKDGNISNVLLGSGNNALVDARLKTGGTLYNASKTNLGPQIGFAWNPERFFGADTANKFVLRGGFGIGYNRQMEASILDIRNNPPGGTVFFSFPVGQLNYGPSAVPANVNQFTDWPSNPNAIQDFDPTTGLPISGGAISLVGVQNDLPSTRTYRYSLDAQYELAPTWVATIGYQGSVTNNYTIKQQMNLLYPDLNPRIFSLQFYSNIADANYNALLTEVRHQFAKNFQFDLQYRWSHTIDMGSNDYFIPTYPWNVNLEKGDADYDIRHNVKLWGMWEPEFFRGNGVLDKLLGRWTVTGILNWHTGFPWTPLYRTEGGCNLIYENSGVCYLRPQSYLGGAGNNYSNDVFQTTGQFPNGASTYFTPVSYTNGPAFPATGPVPAAPGVGRNTFRDAHYFNLDMTLAKVFALPKMRIIGESSQIEFRASAYNVLNKLNLRPLQAFGLNQNSTWIGSVNPTTGAVSNNAAFGKAEAGLPGRVIELQARFSF